MFNSRDSDAPPFSLATWITIICLAIFLTRLLLKLILRRAFKSWRIGSLGWLSLLDIKWRDTKGARVNVASVSMTCAGAGCARGGGRSWFVLRIDGVKVWLPKSSLKSEGKNNSPDKNATPTPISSRRSSVSSNSNLENTSPTTLQHLVTTAFSTVISSVYKLLSILVSHITIEIKIQVELEDTFTAKGTFRAGGNVRSPKNSRLEAWVALEGLSISEIPKKTSTRKPFPAVEIQSVLLLTASAPINTAIATDQLFSPKGDEMGFVKSSMEIGLEFPKAMKGVQIRVVELQRLFAAFPSFNQQESPSQEPKSSNNPLYFLRSLSLTLPVLILSAHYDTPLELLNVPCSRPLPQSATFSLRILDVQGILELDGNSNDDGCVHRDFLGKARPLDAQAKLGFSKIEGKVKVNRNASHTISQMSTFEIGASSVTLTSTWLPVPLASMLRSASPPYLPTAGPRHLNEEAIIIEIVIGQIWTHATFETLDSALTIFSIRPMYSPRSATPRKNRSTILTNLPRVVGSITCIGLDVEVIGPKLVVVSNENNGETDRFFENWSENDAICVTIPTITMAWGAEYVERSLVRSEMDRRSTTRSEKRVSVQEIIHEGDEEIEPLIEDVFGKIPPLSKLNPIRIVPKRPAPKPLDQHSMEYVYRFSLTGNELNAFIRASNLPLESDSTVESRRIDVFSIGPVELTANGKLLGSEQNEGMELLLETHKGETNVLLEKFEIDLWQPQIITCLRDFMRSIAVAKELAFYDGHSISEPVSHPNHQPLIDLLASDWSIYIAVASSDIRIAGSDATTDTKVSRGISLHVGPIVLEYLLQKSLVIAVRSPDRLDLDLRDDITLESNAHIAGAPTPRQALFKITAVDLHVDPVENARESCGRTSKRESVGDESEDISGDWELKNRAFIAGSPGRRKSILPGRVVTQSEGIANIPSITLRVTIQSAEPHSDAKSLDMISLAVDAPRVSLRLDIFHAYLCLLAVSTLISIVPTSPTSSAPKSQTIQRPAPIFSSRGDIADLNLFLTLPNDVRLFIHILRLRTRSSPLIGSIISLDSFLLAGVSPTAPGKWDDIIRLRSTSCEFRPTPENEGLQKFIVVIEVDSARLRIPFRYVFAQIVDNTATLIKALKQLIHLLIKGGNGSILDPQPEGPKQLPRIDINAKMFAIELQDDPFETRLNIIWRAGYEEQISRRDRQDAFDAKVEAIRKMEAGISEDQEEQGEKLSSSTRSGKLNGRHLIGIEEAEHDLKAYNSTNWVKRMRNAIAEQGRREEALTRRLYGSRHNNLRPDSLLPIDLLPISRSSPLARITLQDIRLSITRPSFSREELPKYMHDVGKGLPLDTKFTLLVPLHLSWKMEEARCQIRDYPLPLLHIPPMSGVGNDFSSWELETDFVLGEEVGGKDSIRKAECQIIPLHTTTLISSPYTLIVPRTAMTVKSYATPIVTIRSPFATRIGWGNSIQPAIQSVAKVLDTLTKASPDPSDRVGFWDKIRLQLHWKIQVLFQGEGPVHFHIKGTRDPYALTGFGAGFSKAWRGNVKFLVGLNNQDQEFFQVESEEYILGIPNLRDYVDNAATGIARDPNENDDRSTQYSTETSGAQSRARFRQEADFIKVCAKFINGVRWGVGMALERSCTNYECDSIACRDRTPFNRQCRKFDFIPHWEVQTKTAAAALGDDGLVIDSFAGFRSDFIHFSISLTSPLTLPLPSSSGTDHELPNADSGYNSLHLSPQASTHFWAWWKLFDGSMSLPIRQGKLFPSAQPPAKKFGKHCATIKYRFSLAPLFISHTYRQENWEEWAKGETTVVGLKGKIGRFNVDLHQREQEETVLKPALGTKKTLMRKVFYQAEVDCDEVDLRVVSAIFSEPEKRAMAPELDEEDHDESPVHQDYELADEDLEWIDLDDFVDAIYTIPDQNPRMRVLPFIKCPRFTYYRKIDVEKEAGEAEEVQSNTKFGNEDSHTCLMGCAKDTIMVQIDAARARLAELEREALLPPGSGGGSKEEVTSRIRAMHRIITRLTQLRDANLSPSTSSHANKFRTGEDQPYVRMPSTAGIEAEDQADDAHLPHINSTLYEEWGGWANRYMIHNPAIQVNNTTRDVLLKYYYSSRERRGFVYHLSASAIKFIRDLKKEHEKKHRKSWARRKSTRTGAAPSRRKSVWDETQNTNRLLDDLVKGGGGSFWATGEGEESEKSFGDALDVDPDSAADSLPDSFDLRSGHLCMFIKPQISLQSDIDDKSTIILTAFRAQLKVYDVVDLKIVDDPVNSHVLHQTFGTLDGLQAFYPKAQNSSKTGTSFVPLETLVDLRVEPWGFDRVVPRTSAAVRYDKFNRLRIGSTRSSSSEPTGSKSSNYFDSGTDRISVECTKFSVSANPNHFAAIFNVVTDLLLYSDPLRVSQNKKLEEVVFTRDFSDLGEISKLVINLQQRIRILVDLGQQYQVHLEELDESGRIELFYARAEFSKLSSELNLVLQAITRAQDVNGGSVKKGSSKVAGIQFEARAAELVWHMLDGSDTPFAKFSVNGVEFSWISKQDSSISNRLIIKDLSALNSSPDHVFAEIISKHSQAAGHELAKVDVFAAILWNALAPVGGISIVEQFELHLHPIRLQLEHSIGLKIMDYVFSQRRKKETILPKEENEKKSLRSSKSSSLLVPLNSHFNRSADSLLSSRPASIRSFVPSIFEEESPLSSFITSSTSRSKRDNPNSVLPIVTQEGGLNAEEMRLRASLNRTFILVDITATVLCLTYRSEKADSSPLPDIYNIVYNTPSIQYRSKTWSFLDMLDELKKDVIKATWSQKGALIGQLLQTAHRKLPLSEVRKAAKSSIMSRLNLSKTNPKRITSGSNLNVNGGEVLGSPLRLSMSGASSMKRDGSEEGEEERSVSPVNSRAVQRNAAATLTVRTADLDDESKAKLLLGNSY